MLGGLPYSITASLIMQIGNQVAGRIKMEMPESFIEIETEEDYFGEWAEYWQQERLPDAPGNAQQQVQADSNKDQSKAIYDKQEEKE